MKIAAIPLYGDTYLNDRLFDSTSCKIGQNLLSPGIKLKEYFCGMDIEYHTIDVYNNEEIDKYLFFDIPGDSIMTVSSIKDICKYIFRKKWKNDILYKCLKSKEKSELYLIVQEPNSVWPKSHIRKYYKYFNKIITWDDNLIDNIKYFKYYIPQTVPSIKYYQSFRNKKLLTLIASNKTSKNKNELYSKRREIIHYCEMNKVDFDFYGYGWEKEKFANYKGTTGNKLDTLSKYKFCICYENETNASGYITEKIFDCFFSHCIPIYLGAENIDNYVPKNTYIDARKFRGYKEMIEYIKNIDIKTYDKMLDNIDTYISSNRFKETFSVDNYIRTIANIVLEDKYV